MSGSVRAQDSVYNLKSHLACSSEQQEEVAHITSGMYFDIEVAIALTSRPKIVLILALWGTVISVVSMYYDALILRATFGTLC